MEAVKTRVSTKGHIVLPSPIRRRLGIRADDTLDISVEDGRVVLTPEKKQKYEVRIIEDPLTGLPVLTAGPNAPILTSEQVEEMLADFP